MFTKEALDGPMQEVATMTESLTRLYWIGHAAMANQSYDSQDAQFRDARALGRLAEGIAHLREARGDLTAARSLVAKG